MFAGLRGITRAAAVCTLLIHAASGAEPSTPWHTIRTIAVDDSVWHWNWGSWDQDKIVTFGDYQYTVYWDEDRVFVLARRDLRDDAVQTIRLRQFKLSSDDTHRNTCLGVSAKDGRLHLSWDHHNNPLNYTRSVAGFLTNPPPRISEEDIEPRQSITADSTSTSRVTYPLFLHDANGQLFLFFRLGVSGDGENLLFRYDSATGTWARVGRVFSGRGTYAPWQGDKSRNAYFHDVVFDARNRLHVTWVYREAGSTWASNHDLHYAYSDDGGKTWCNNAGQRIGDMAADDPIELADPGIVVREIPVYSWVMNSGCMAIDSKQRPHVVTFKIPSPRRPLKLEHNPPADIASTLRFVHYWRDDSGQWLGGSPISAGIESGPPARGDVVFGANDTLYYYYQPKDAKGGFVCLQASPDDQWQSWRACPLTGPQISGLDASKHDRSRWRADHILSITARSGEQGFAIVDLKLP